MMKPEDVAAAILLCVTLPERTVSVALELRI